MKKSSQEILNDIDSTLDQLIHNAELVKKVSLTALLENEIEALQKTQESLLARLVSMNELISPEERKKIKDKKDHQKNLKQKVSSFSKLNNRFMKNMASTFGIKKRKKIPFSRSKKAKAS